MSRGMCTFSGEVIRGTKKGSEIGIPTLNLDITESSFDIDFGVYLCSVEIKGILYRGIAHYGKKSIGTCEKNKIFFEVHVFGFDRNIYGNEVSVNLLKKIRDVREFKSDEDLLKQIKKDIAKANKYFKEND